MHKQRTQKNSRISINIYQNRRKKNRLIMDFACYIFKIRFLRLENLSLKLLIFIKFVLLKNVI